MRYEIKKLLLKNPDGRTAAIAGDEAITYGRLAAETERMKELFSRLDAEVIAIFLPNGVRFLSALFGVIYAGKTAFPLNTALVGGELAGLLAHANVRAVVSEEGCRGILETAREAAGLEFQIITEKTEQSDTTCECGHRTREQAAPNEAMLLLNTSGTTGNIKIVGLSQVNIESNVRAYLNKVDFERYGGDKYILAAPFSSAYGIMIIFASIIKGFTLIALRENENPLGMLALAKKHEAVYYEGGSSMLIMLDMIVRNKSANIEYPKYFGFGGSRVSAEILRRLMRTFPDKDFCLGYGMTEASPLITKFSKHASIEKADSVGTPIDNELVLIKTGDGLTDSPNVIGEILVSGPNVTLGYINNERETQKAYQNGFLHTGDIGYFDDDGYLYLCGRKKNIIIVRGFNVYPDEIEDVLMSGGAAVDCFVYGEQDESGNERVCADVVPASNAVKKEELMELCRMRLAQYKLPEKINIVENITKTLNGKNRRRP